MQRQSWPTAWLMTDERLGNRLAAAIARAAAAGAGVIVRHHASSEAERHTIAALVVERGAPLGISRDVRMAVQLGAGLVHNPEGDASGLPISLSVHDERQAIAAAALGPALVFVSPIFPTSSHPGASSLGEEEGRRLARLTRSPAYALGGIRASMEKDLLTRGWAGWAGIDAWS
nr:thiamine phosphate synthase [uncultured Sphingomonas sp.]